MAVQFGYETSVPSVSWICAKMAKLSVFLKQTMLEHLKDHVEKM